MLAELVGVEPRDRRTRRSSTRSSSGIVARQRRRVRLGASTTQREPIAERALRCRSSRDAAAAGARADNALAATANGEIGTRPTRIDRRSALHRTGGAGRPPTRPAAGRRAGYVRLGLSFERQQQNFRAQMLGALTVVGLLVVIAVVATLLLTRGLVAPMRRLMRAARAVGSGRLDVYVPARSSDELGLLTHTFNHMTQRLAESQAEVGELPAHARGKGRAAHEASSRSRPRTPTSSRSTTS